MEQLVSLETQIVQAILTLLVVDVLGALGVLDLLGTLEHVVTRASGYNISFRRAVRILILGPKNPIKKQKRHKHIGKNKQKTTL